MTNSLKSKPQPTAKKSPARPRSRGISAASATIAVAAITTVGGIAIASLHDITGPTAQPAVSPRPEISRTSSRTLVTAPSLASRPLVPGDNSEFVADLTYPDGSSVIAGQHFIKKWKIRNIGTARWIGRYLAPLGQSTGSCTYPLRVPVPTTSPGHAAIISVPIAASGTPGLCYVTWKMISPTGALYFPNEIGIWFDVKVIARPTQ